MIVATIILSLGVGGLLTGALVFQAIKKKPSIVLSDEELDKLADSKAKTKLLSAEKEISKMKAEADEYIKKRQQDLAEQEKLLVQREESLMKRSKVLDEKSEELSSQIFDMKKQKEELEKTRAKLKKELERISNLTRDEAKQQLIKQIEEDLKQFKAKQIRAMNERIKDEAMSKSKEILIESMQRITTDYVGETTVSTVKIDDEKVKGRIIGKEGRNIRAFEQLTGVDVVVDEAPNTIALSSFDPLRREIARVALTKLIADSRIHPGSIEDEVRKAKNEIAEEIKKNGQILADEADWVDMDPKLMRLVGKMKYRTSYGQTLMQHTIEVIRIGAVIAAELGADVALVKKACLLHDVGKVLTHKVEGAHHHISGQIARKYGLDEKLVNAIEAHHLDIEPQSVEALIVYIADAISGARPGARKDSYEAYIKRVEGIENTAKDVAGDRAKDIYAIHAGREVRVIVNPNVTNDDDITILAQDIASKIQETQTYPGVVQVTVIREKRAEAVAR